MRSSQPSARATRRTCSRVRRTRTRSSSIRPAAAMQELGKVLDETKPDVDPVLRRRPRRDVLGHLRPVVRHRRRQPRDRQVRRARAQPADPPRDGRGHPQQAGRRSQLRHGLLGGRRARARVLDSVRVRDRQAQHPGRSRSSPTSTCRRCRRRAAARRWARRSPRSSRAARSAWPSSPAAACRTSPAPRKYHYPEFDFDRWLVSQMEAGNTDALLNMTGTQLDEVGNTEMLSWAVHVRRHRPAAGRAHRLHPDLAPRAVHDALPAAARAHATRRRKVDAAVRRLPVPEPGLTVLQAPAVRGLRPEQAAVRVAPQRRCCATASSTTSRRSPTSTSCTGQQRKAARAMIDVGKGGAGQRPRQAAGRRRRAPAAGADVAARDLLDDAQARPGGDGRGSQALTIRTCCQTRKGAALS